MNRVLKQKKLYELFQALYVIKQCFFTASRIQGNCWMVERDNMDWSIRSICFDYFSMQSCNGLCLFGSVKLFQYIFHRKSAECRYNFWLNYIYLCIKKR